MKGNTVEDLNNLRQACSLQPAPSPPPSVLHLSIPTCTTTTTNTIISSYLLLRAVQSFLNVFSENSRFDFRHDVRKTEREREADYQRETS